MRNLAKVLAAAGLLLPAPLAAQAGGVVTPTTAPQKLICKSKAETGSFVKKTRVCLTSEQWKRSAENHQKYAQDLQEDLRTRPCGEC